MGLTTPVEQTLGKFDTVHSLVSQHSSLNIFVIKNDTQGDTIIRPVFSVPRPLPSPPPLTTEVQFRYSLRSVSVPFFIPLGRTPSQSLMIDLSQFL